MLRKLLFWILAGIMLVFIAYFSLAAKYKYTTAQDYQYALQNSRHITKDVLLKQGKFSFNTPQNWDTGFIQLNISSTLSGYFVEPYVEIMSGQQHSILSFERGAQGVRYINLPVSGDHRQKIQLIAHHLDIKDQQARVILFANPSVQNDARVLVIAPHPDDAEIAAFGFYSQHHSLVLTITAGEAGAHTYDEIYAEANQHYRMKGKLRVWNSISVPMLGGVSPEYAVNLGYFDDTLAQMAANKESPVKSRYTDIDDVNDFRGQNISTLTPVSAGVATWLALLKDIKQIIRRYQPDIIVAPYPALDWHPDHKYATIAVINALKQLNLRQGQLFLYTNHFTANSYFPYGRQGELVPIPPDFRQSIYFDSLYSFTLPRPKEKIFALEAMNDLRLDTSWLSVSGAFKVLWRTLGNQLLFKDQSYFRRAVRENELFLVVDFSSLYSAQAMRQILNESRE